MADDEIVVGSFPKNNREDVRVMFSNFKGYDLLGVRVWFKGDNDDLRPSKAGVTVRVDLLPELMDLLEKAKTIAIEKEFLTEEDFDLSDRPEPEE